MKVAHSLSTARAVVLALSVLCGCASTLPPAPPPPPPAPAVPATRFVAAPVFDDAEEDEWVGSYEGVADIYLAEEDSWQRGVAIQLFVQRDGQHLRILGQLALAASRHSFYVGDVEAGAEPMLSGEYADGDSRYAYSLVRSDDVLKGFVKMHLRADASAAFVPGDEWHVDVQRRALTDLR